MIKFTSRNIGPVAIIVAGALVFPLVYLVRELAIAGIAGFPLDDSWIHLVFARSIARGDFFAYNPNTPVAGSTAPLWTFILGVGYALTHSPVIMPKFIGIVLTVLIGILAWRIAELLGMKRFPAVIIALLCVAAPRIVWAAVSGMEVSLYITLCLASTYAYLRYCGSPDWKFYLPWIIAAIAVWARPELMTQPVFFLLHQLIIRFQRSPQSKQSRTASLFAPGVIPMRRLALGVIVFCIGLIPFFALNEWLSSVVLPLTFSVKAHGTGTQGLIESGEYVAVMRRMVMSFYIGFVNSIKWLWVQDNLYLAIATVIGLVTLTVTSIRRQTRGIHLVGLLLLALHLLLYAPARTIVTGSLDFGQFGRYAAQTSVIMILFGALCISGWIQSRIKNIASARTLLVVCAGLTTLLLAAYYALAPTIGRSHQWPSMDWYLPFLRQGELVHVLIFALWSMAVVVIALRVLEKSFSAQNVTAFMLIMFFGFTVVENIQTADEYAWDVKNINDTQVALGNWLQTTPPGTIYATNDIGAMAYFAENAKIIDLVGLVQPEIAEKLAESQSSDQTVLWALQQWHPAYLICFDEWYPVFVHDARRSGVIERIKTVAIPNNITCGGKGITAMQVYAVHPEHLPDLFSGAKR